MLAGGELVQDPGQRAGRAVQLLPGQLALGRDDLHDRPPPVREVRVPVHQPGPVQVGQDAADGGQGQVQPGGEFADGDRAAAQLLERGDVPQAQRRGRLRGRGVQGSRREDMKAVCLESGPRGQLQAAENTRICTAQTGTPADPD